MLLDLPSDILFYILHIGRFTWSDLQNLTLVHPALYETLSQFKLTGKRQLFRCDSCYCDVGGTCGICISNTHLWNTIHHFEYDDREVKLYTMIINKYLTTPHTALMYWVHQNMDLVSRMYRQYNCADGVGIISTDIAISLELYGADLDTRSIRIMGQNRYINAARNMLSRNKPNQELLEIYKHLLNLYVYGLAAYGFLGDVLVGNVYYSATTIRNNLIIMMPRNAKFLYDLLHTRWTESINIIRLSDFCCHYLDHVDLFGSINLQAWSYAEWVFRRIFGGAPAAKIEEQDIALRLAHLYTGISDCGWDFYDLALRLTTIDKSLITVNLRNVQRDPFSDIGIIDIKLTRQRWFREEFKQQYVKYLLDPRVIAIYRTLFCDQHFIARTIYCNDSLCLSDLEVLYTYLQTQPPDIIYVHNRIFVPELEDCGFVPQNLAEWYATYSNDEGVRALFRWAIAPMIEQYQLLKLQAKIKDMAEQAYIAQQNYETKMMEESAAIDKIINLQEMDDYGDECENLDDCGDLDDIEDE